MVKIDDFQVAVELRSCEEMSLADVIVSRETCL
jgi:hypothetical protein